MSLIRKHGAVLQAWACLDLVYSRNYNEKDCKNLHCTNLTGVNSD